MHGKLSVFFLDKQPIYAVLVSGAGLAHNDGDSVTGNGADRPDVRSQNGVDANLVLAGPQNGFAPMNLVRYRELSNVGWRLTLSPCRMC